MDKYPPLTTAALVPYSSLSAFSDVVPAEEMAKMENKWREAVECLVSLKESATCTYLQYHIINNLLKVCQ